MKDYRKYLNPKVVAKLKNIELIAKLVVEGFITGLHRSPFHGFSVEFAEHRAYRPGDEIKYLDWKVLGRTEKYFVKQFEEETNTRIMIVLDASASMKFASGDNLTKYEYGSYLAASLALLMIQQRDAAGLALYDTEIRKYLTPNSRPSYIREILKTLETNQPQNQTGTANCLNLIAERMNKRSLVVIISDFFDDPDSTLKALQHFRHNSNEVIAFQILDDRELDFKFGQSANFVDAETNETLITHPYQIQKAYQDSIKKFTANLKSQCHFHNIDYNLITTSTPFDKALVTYLNKRKKV
ncbi:MAG: hypothetical protein A2X64_09240 [Ignavibacteria bacterium GWF2_33_9]|nr:MAG: hypothetical protein A2X64_09240 [Ignavibacteria bacterium GWF2_33_9]